MKRLLNLLANIKANPKAMFLLETLFFLALMLILFFTLVLSNSGTVQESVYNQF
jgi:hypothetical protein